VNRPTAAEARAWVGAARIEGACLLRLSLPLLRPYHLSFGTLTHFDTVLCGLNLEGRLVWGETTPLPGYGRETADQAWAWGLAALPRVLGAPAWRAFVWGLGQSTRNPFCAAALLGALEWPALAGELARPAEVPALAAIGGSTPRELVEDVRRLTAGGYTTLKLKVGRDWRDDLARVEAVLAALPAGATLRADANQALDLRGASELWRALDHPAVEHLEQPFPRGDWRRPARLLERFPLARLCLDESVWLERDLARVLPLGPATAVKLKLMKQGSAWRTLGMARQALAQGRRVVFGNGVQGEVGSLAELAIYRKLGLSGAAELNGFAKQAGRVVAGFPLEMSRGRFLARPCPADLGFGPELARAVVQTWRSGQWPGGS
jgi:L-alanine-DL-glutamate epimerase-like enolase superfamily enzyme